MRKDRHAAVAATVARLSEERATAGLPIGYKLAINEHGEAWVACADEAHGDAFVGAAVAAPRVRLPVPTLAPTTRRVRL